MSHRRPILTYLIASGDIHYVVQNERTVYLDGDPETGFRLYGQVAGGSESSSVNLAEMLLEFALAWNVSGDARASRRQMHIFGRRLAEALVAQRTRTKLVNGILGQATHALEDVFRSLDASFARHQTPSEVRYQLDLCPLRMAAEATGMEQQVELAHHALNAIYQMVVDALDPELDIQLPSGPHVEQVIRVRGTTRDKQWRAGNPAGRHILSPIDINSKS